jgi:hypothetical protein
MMMNRTQAGVAMIAERRARLGVLSLFTLAALAACGDGSSHELTAPLAPALASASSRGATTTTTNEFITPFEFDWEGCVETVRYSGTLHAVTHTTITSTGSIHVSVQAGPVGGVAGVGLTSGAKYEEPGMAHDTYNLNGTAWPLTETFVNNFQVIGQGQIPNSNFHETFHITINADGRTTVVFDNVRAECH